MELVNTGDDVEEEKDELLETFAAWAGRVCEALSAQGYWCDYIDPCSGLPVRVCSVIYCCCCSARVVTPL